MFIPPIWRRDLMLSLKTSLHIVNSSWINCTFIYSLDFDIGDIWHNANEIYTCSCKTVSTTVNVFKFKTSSQLPPRKSVCLNKNDQTLRLILCSCPAQTHFVRNYIVFRFIETVFHTVTKGMHSVLSKTIQPNSLIISTLILIKIINIKL